MTGIDLTQAADQLRTCCNNLCLLHASPFGANFHIVPRLTSRILSREPPWQVGMSFSGVPGGALRTESPSTIALHGCTSAGPKISSEVISFFPNRASWRMAPLGNSAAAGLFTTFQLTRKSIINDISWSICLTDSGAEFGWLIVWWGERGDKD